MFWNGLELRLPPANQTLMQLPPLVAVGIDNLLEANELQGVPKDVTKVLFRDWPWLARIKSSVLGLLRTRN